MVRFILFGFLFISLTITASFAGSPFGQGIIDKDLKYDGFEVTADGVLTGQIVNTSSHTRQGVRLDMWTTNAQETRIFWRKTLTIGDLAPGAAYTVKESYDIGDENPARIKFMFRLPHKDNYRN